MPTSRRDFPVSEHFWLHELEVSASHPDLVEPIPDALLPPAIRLVVTVLEPLRQRFGPCRVLSGYRPRRLNDAVQGSPTSQHLRAEAADCVFHDTPAVFAALRRDRELYPLGQVIHYPTQGFLHLALPSERYPRPAFFVKRNGVLHPK